MITDVKWPRNSIKIEEHELKVKNFMLDVNDVSDEIKLWGKMFFPQFSPKYQILSILEALKKYER